MSVQPAAGMVIGEPVQGVCRREWELLAYLVHGGCAVVLLFFIVSVYPFQVGSERIMVGIWHPVYLRAEGLQPFAVQDVIDAEQEEILVIGDPRSESGGDISILQSPLHPGIGIGDGCVV